MESKCLEFSQVDTYLDFIYFLVKSVAAVRDVMGLGGASNGRVMSMTEPHGVE